MKHKKFICIWHDHQIDILNDLREYPSLNSIITIIELEEEKPLLAVQEEPYKLLVEKYDSDAFFDILDNL